MNFKDFKPSSLAIRNRVTIYAFTVLLILFGIMQYNATPKEKMPEIVFPYFMISTIHPGTSPADMENLVTRPLEKQLKGINGIETISSNSIQDFSSIIIKFEISADEIQAYLDIKQAVDDARSDLPTDLYQEPQISRIDLSEIPILYINLSGDLGLVQLKANADRLQDEIEALEEITRVDIAGALDREIQIDVDLYKMQAAGLSFNSIQSAVASENLTMSGGQIDSDGMRRNLRIVGEFTDVDQVGEIVLQEGIRIKDIASARDGFKDRESYARLDSRDVVTLNVIKRSGQNLIFAVDKIKAIVEDFRKTASDNLTITLSGDSSTQTRNSVSDLFNTIVLGFIVVVFVLMFFMGETNAVFVGIAIPFSMLIAFIFIPLVGFTMNMVVLMSFILVLGIVVDNSIVVVENIYRHFTTTPGLSIETAARRGVGEVALAVFTGTLTTIAPFLPLVFMPGIPGKFMSSLPITIIIALSASMLVAYIMNPVFAVTFMKPANGNHGDAFRKPSRGTLLLSAATAAAAALLYAAGWLLPANLLALGLILYYLTRYILHFLIDRFQSRVLPAFMNAYRRALAFIIRGRRPYALLAGILLLFLFSFVLMRVSPPRVVFFPNGDPNTLYIYISLPEGTHIDVTNRICRDVENRVYDVIGRNNPDVESVVSNVAVNAGSGLFDRFTQDKLAKVTVNFVEYKFRTEERPTTAYLDMLRDRVRGIPGAEIRIDREAMGPPTGMPINIEITGDEIEELIASAGRLEAFIRGLGIQGIERLKSSMEVNKPELILTVDRDKANQLGISTAQIGMTLRTAIYGAEISTFREGEEEYPIQLRLARLFRNDLDALLSLDITAGGRGGDAPPPKIPLSAVASVAPKSSYGGITRIDTQRVITLSSNILSGYNANQIIRAINRELPEFELKPGYSVRFTGEQDMQQEIGGFLVKALLIAMALILIILIAQFNSIAKPLIILVQIFFSFTGVLLGFTIFHLEFSVMMTGMGIIAVAGIVVKNAIIIIDYTDKLVAGGLTVPEAVVQAGATRLTPVMLTALSTILGLLPLAIGMNFNFWSLFTRLDPQIYWGGDNAAFWNSLSWTIIFGLSFATILTLMVVPAMYTLHYRKSGRGR